MHGDAEAPNDAELLYTSFGRSAKHRETLHGSSRYFSDSCITICSLIRLEIRLISDAAAFTELHGETPLTGIVGWSPWRLLSCTLSFACVASACSNRSRFSYTVANITQGILPDSMHLIALALIPDIAVSLLCDLSDGPQREQSLSELFEDYRAWSESQRAPDALDHK